MLTNAWTEINSTSSHILSMCSLLLYRSHESHSMNVFIIIIIIIIIIILLGIFFIYISSAIPRVPPSPPLPYPPTPTSWPWRSPILRHIKFARPMGLSFQWWLTKPSSDTYAARDRSSGGYWLVHIVVPPIGLQIPLVPWVLSLAPPLGACDPSNS